jgi:hypothetical protein
LYLHFLPVDFKSVLQLHNFFAAPPGIRQIEAAKAWVPPASEVKNLKLFLMFSLAFEYFQIYFKIRRESENYELPHFMFVVRHHV